MDTPKLKAQKRTLIGKRVKTLRANGQLPGVLYGGGIVSMPIALDGREASRLLARASSSICSAAPRRYGLSARSPTCRFASAKG